MSTLQAPANKSGVAGWAAWRPLMIISVCLIVGVGVADVLPHTPALAAGLSLAAVACLLGAWRFASWRSDVALVVGAVSVGAAWYTARLCRGPTDISRWAPSRPASITARIVSRRGPRAAVCAALAVRQSAASPPSAVSGLFYLRCSRLERVPVGSTIRIDRPVLQPWRGRTNPAQRAPALYWSRRRVWCRASADDVVVVRGPSGVSMAVHVPAWREALNRRLTLAMPGGDASRYATLLGAIVYGASLSELPPVIVDLYRRTGTIHVLVVSGSQVTVLVTALLLLTGGRRRPVRLPQLLVVLAAAFLYATLCGREASIMRASVLAGILLLGLYGGRRYDVATATAFVFALLVMAEPAELFSPGLQLTFAASVGVVGAIALMPGRDAWIGWGWPGRVAYGLVLVLVSTAGAWVMTFPILTSHFGGAAVLGNLANAFIVPLAALVLLLGLPATLLALLHPLYAYPLLWACRWALQVSISINSVAATWPAAYLEPLRGGLGFSGAWYAAALAAYLLARFGDRRSRRIGLALGVASLAALVLVAASPARPRAPTVTWLDVGEGLCTVIETPDGHFALFDAGSRDPQLGGRRAAISVLLPYLRWRLCRRLDAVIISHADTDHFNAVAWLLDRVPVGLVVISPYGEGKRYEELLATLREHGVRVLVASSGASLQLGRRVRLRFIHPQPYPITGTRSDDNNNCLVAVVQADRWRVLLTGDLETEGQQVLLRAAGRAALRADAWQVPHHARAGALCEPFADAVGARVSVVPCGPDYLGGKCDGKFLSHLARRGSTVLTTAARGAVTATLAASGLRWRSFLPAPAGAR